MSSVGGKLGGGAACGGPGGRLNEYRMRNACGGRKGSLKIPLMNFDVHRAADIELYTFGFEKAALKVCRGGIPEGDAPAGGDNAMPGKAAAAALGVKDSHHLPGAPGGAGAAAAREP